MRAQDRILELDGVRGIASVWVMCFHYFSTMGHAGIFTWVLMMGWSGVDLFFVLSGFLVGSVICRHHNSQSFIKAFYLRRLFRIVPLFYVVVFLYYVLNEVLPKSPVPTAMPYWAYLLFMNDFLGVKYSTLGSISIAWSLAIEEKFYAISPLAGRFLSRRALIASVVAALLLSVVWQCWIRHTGGLRVPLSMIILRWEGLCLGMLAALGASSIGVEVLKTRPWRKHTLGWLAVSWCLLRFDGYEIFGFVLWGGSLGLRIGLFYLGIILVSISYSGSLATAWLRSRFFRWLGSISYGVYLLHPLVEKAIWGILLKMGYPPHPEYYFMLGLVAVGMTLLLAHSSWTLFESKFVKYSRRKFKYEPKGSPESLWRPSSIADSEKNVPVAL